LKIALGSDHAGYQLKNLIKESLNQNDMSFTDFGTFKLEAGDYPEFAFKVTNAIIKEECDRGILICATGIGMCMSANKMKGIRASMAYDEETAELSRLHNDSNILCLGARQLNEKMAIDIINIWLNTSFEGGRHQKRLDLMKKLTGL
jgi:ribose 5-phosphate isomerase B